MQSMNTVKFWSQFVLLYYQSSNTLWSNSFALNVAVEWLIFLVRTRCAWVQTVARKPFILTDVRVIFLTPSSQKTVVVPYGMPDHYPLRSMRYSILPFYDT
jgi:hypothetical protein